MKAVTWQGNHDVRVETVADPSIERWMSVEYCHYEHSWRELGLSDHSPLIARLRRSFV
jgi:hypothetical protein